MEHTPSRIVLALALLVGCGEIVPIDYDATTPDAVASDAPVPDAGSPVSPDARPMPDAVPRPDAGDAPDAGPCIAYDFELEGQNLVLSYALELAELAGSNYLTWTYGPFDRRGFGIDGGATTWIDSGERLSITWSTDPRSTSITYYPGNEPARLYVTWPNAAPSIIVLSGNGGAYTWTGVSPTSIELEPTGTGPIALRRLSYCP